MAKDGKRVLRVPMPDRGAETASPIAHTPPPRRMVETHPAWRPGRHAATMGARAIAAA
ncbi:hypothetical protein MPLSOD_490001 [Mesorhizobium sp. SOD10]|nr:hypothetical protein MPLSOD_490001 [Mesorhizobium sp. SOD10]